VETIPLASRKHMCIHTPTADNNIDAVD